MPCFLAYGLTIESPLELWAERSAEAPTLTVVHGPRGSADGDPVVVDQMGSIRIPSSRTIEISSAEPTCQRLFQHLAIGPALGYYLHRTGCAVLHGSSVAVSGKAVVLLGASYLGKSTLAAALRRRGHPHVSDGMCVAKIHDAGIDVLPGPPFARLWPDSVRTIGEQPDRLLRVFPDLDKRLLPIRETVQRDPIVLGRVYCLSVGGDAVTIARVSPAAATWQLIRNYYLTEQIGARDSHIILKRAANVAQKVTVSQLSRPNDLARLDDVALAIEADMEAS